ncbi:hypothetical protein QQF64_003512 [Cirrhinus molitorella]|uniref:Uncharacterized protein n=1 Tax=Cirrhinus molitorella TaxID=172907 RepID=A0ABR3MLI7_9TELE
MNESFSTNESKRALHQPPLTAASCKGAVREKVELLEPVHSTLHLQLVVSSVGKKEVVVLLTEEQVVGT